MTELYPLPARLRMNYNGRDFTGEYPTEVIKLPTTIMLEAAERIEHLEAELKTQVELERQYSNSLGRLAQLCDLVIPALIGEATVDKEELGAAVQEIREYVEAVRP